MRAPWLPGWERIEGNDAGSWASGPRRPKLVLHTTEGRSIDGALGAYRANNSWPHATVDFATQRRVQHVPLDRPARALRNAPGGVETNRAPGVIQVEIMGYAAESHTWPADMIDWLGREVVGPLCRATGVPLTSTTVFHGEGAGWVLARSTARQRLSGQAWLDYSGVLGHQHVPENDHWDPGALPIHRVLAATSTTPTPPPSPPKEDLTMADIETILRSVERAKPLAVRLGSNGKHGSGRALRAGEVWIISGAGMWHVQRPALDALALEGVVRGLDGRRQPTAVWGAEQVASIPIIPAA